MKALLDEEYKYKEFIKERDEPAARLWCFCEAEHRYVREGIEFWPWREGLQELGKL